MSKVSEMLKFFALEGVKVCAAFFFLFSFFRTIYQIIFFSLLALVVNEKQPGYQVFSDTLKKKVKFKFILSSLIV